MTNRFYTIATAAVLAVACRIGFAADPVAPPAKPADPAAAAAPVKLSKEESSFFESKVRPVLAANCYKCHSAESGKSKGGLVLDTREGVLKGGENGAILVPGSPEKSKLITAIGYNDSDLQMPPKGEKLSPKEIADLTQWVTMGQMQSLPLIAIGLVLLALSRRAPTLPLASA